MDYKKYTLWIFVLLMFIIGVMFVFPHSLTIGIGAIALPVLIVLQAFIILRAKDQSQRSFEDEWYDNP
jgi:hypothetical protein